MRLIVTCSLLTACCAVMAAPPQGAKAIEQQLASKVVAERIDAARALPTLTEAELKPMIPLLTKAVRDDYWDVRENAADALRRLGADAVPALIELLQTKEYYAQWYAARTVGRIGPDAKAAVPALGKVLEGKGVDASLEAAAAAEATGEVAPIIAPLTAALATENDTLRDAASSALGKAGKAAVPGLIKMVASPRREVMYAAARALGQIGTDAGEAAPEMVKAMLRDVEYTRESVKSIGDGYVKDRTIRYAIRDSAPTRALGALGAPSVLLLLEARLTDDALQLRFVNDAMGRVSAGGVNVNAVALAALQAATDPARKAKLVSMVGTMGDAAVTPLCDALKDASPVVRKQAAIALGKLTPAVGKPAIPALEQAAKDADAGVAQAAAEAVKALSAAPAN